MALPFCSIAFVSLFELPSLPRRPDKANSQRKECNGFRKDDRCEGHA